jgi:hypothetical protein
MSDLDHHHHAIQAS